MLKLLIFSAVFGLTYSGGLPKILKQNRCRSGEQSLEKCLVSMFTKAYPLMVKGMPEIGLPKLDPFRISKYRLNGQNGNGINIEGELENIKMTGGSKAQLKYIKIDPKTNSVEVKIFIPTYEVEMDYESSGNLWLIPLESSGSYESTLSNNELTVKGNLEKYKIKGVEYFNVTNFKSTIYTEDAETYLEAGGPLMQAAANVITNYVDNNMRRVLDAFGPIISKEADKIYAKIANRVLSKVPASEWMAL